MIQSIIGTSFTGGGNNPPPVTFVASNYNPLEGTTITFTISGITGVSEGTLLYWWIDGTSGQFSRADQFVENMDNSTLQLYNDGSGTLGGQFTLTPNQGNISFNFYIGYSLYGGFLNLPSDVFVLENITFDVTANWSLRMVVDEASFRIFLESGGKGGNSLTDVTITDFSLVNGRLICNLSATGIYLYLNNIGISDIVSFGNITGLQQLYLNNNHIITFDPTQALPNSLQDLTLENNQIITFNPTQALPNSLTKLNLTNNQIVTFDPTQALPTGLRYLYLNNNYIVTFDPTQALPNSLFYLYLNNNQMTTLGYSASESWASAMSVITGRGTIYFNNNINGVIGRNLESILVIKGWTVQGDPDPLPFDITANWGLTTPLVTDEESFITFLESGEDGNNNTNSLTDVTITDFSLVNGRLICNLHATGIYLYLNNIGISDIVSFGNIPGLQQLNLNNNQIVTFNPTQALPTRLRYLYLNNNYIVTFDPTIALPSALWALYLNGNNIITFDPTIPIPSLIFLSLDQNDIVTFDPSIALPNNLSALYLGANQIVTFNPSIPLPNSLQQLSIGVNQIVTFDPTLPLPNSLQNLSLNNNQIVTFDPSIALPNNLRFLNLGANQIVTFNPSIALPNSLRNLTLFENKIVTFNPTLPLPNSLQTLSMQQNLMTTAGYIASEPWANAMAVRQESGTINLSSNINSVSGTNLQTILISKGWTVTV